MNTTPSSTLHFTSTTASDRPRSDQDQPQVDATRRVRAAGERALVLGGGGAGAGAAAGPNQPPTKQTRIVEPSPGMVVLSVLGPNGEGDSVDPFTDTLMVEVMTSREAREQLGH